MKDSKSSSRNLQKPTGSKGNDGFHDALSASTSSCVTQTALKDIMKETLSLLTDNLTSTITRFDDMCDMWKSGFAALESSSERVQQSIAQLAESVCCLSSRLDACEKETQKPGDSAVLVQLPPFIGAAVLVQGLKSDIYNGRFGTCIGHDASAGRWAIQFWHDTPAVNIREEHLRVNAPCPRCESCMGGRTICPQCEYGDVDGRVDSLPRCTSSTPASSGSTNERNQKD